MFSQENQDSAFWVIVPAAGIGKRMSSAIPKQYLKLQGKTVLEHTIARLLSVNRIRGVLVCLARNDEHWHSLAIASHERVHTVHGGQERMHSVYNALSYLKANHQVSDEFVLVHDAVRPCVRKLDVERLIAAVDKKEGDFEAGAILATPAVDTLKRVDVKHRILETLERENCWRAQTPQMFRLNLLQRSIEVLLNRNQIASDESAVMEASGLQPGIVEGSQENIKLTLPADIPLLEAILGVQCENGEVIAQ